MSESVILRVQSSIDFIKYTEFSIKVDQSITFKDLLPLIIKELKITKSADEIEFTFTKSGVMSIVDSTNSHNKISTLDFKEDFVKVSPKINSKFLSMRNTIVFSYSGPIVIMAYFYFSLSLSTTPSNMQLIAFILSVIHYSKRVFESIYIHSYSNEEFADYSMLFGIVFYYWGLFAVAVGYNIFNVNYTQEVDFLVVFALLFLVCEYGNFDAHNVFRILKIKNKGKRGIPEGNMFGYVSCAHYFWELCTWICFAILVRTYSAWAFTLFSLISMSSMAIKKHQGYQTYFKEKYPKERKAMIPFIY